MTTIPPEMRLWRTDDRTGRSIHSLLSNDPTRPSPDDPFIGTMESAVVAEDIVSTHNGSLRMFGKRYPKVMSDAEVNPKPSEDEVYFKVSPGEKAQLIQLTEWLNSGPFRTLPLIEKLDQAVRG